MKPDPEKSTLLPRGRGYPSTYIIMFIFIYLNGFPHGYAGDFRLGRARAGRDARRARSDFPPCQAGAIRKSDPELFLAQDGVGHVDDADALLHRRLTQFAVGGGFLDPLAGHQNKLCPFDVADRA